MMIDNVVCAAAQQIHLAKRVDIVPGGVNRASAEVMGCATRAMMCRFCVHIGAHPCCRSAKAIAISASQTAMRLKVSTT
jgi:hypothetical protein